MEDTAPIGLAPVAAPPPPAATLEVSTPSPVEVNKIPQSAASPPVSKADRSSAPTPTLNDSMNSVEEQEMEDAPKAEAPKAEERKETEAVSRNSSGRARKAVAHFQTSSAPTEKKAPPVVAGAGVEVGSIGASMENFDKLRSDDDVCRVVHLLMYGSKGKKVRRQ